MSNELFPRKRRVRYSGKNPRKFEEKYKELNPERYAKDVQKVIESGRTACTARSASMKSWKY